MQSLTSKMLKSPQKTQNYSSSNLFPRQLAIEIWANLFQNNTFQLLQSDPTWPYFWTFAGHNQSFSKASYFCFTIQTQKKSHKNPQNVSGIWVHGFCWVFFSMVSGVTKRPPGCWIRRRYSKVTAVLSRRLETGSQLDEVVWNHDFFSWWRLGWLGSRKFGVEIVKTKWLSHVLTWKEMKRSLKDLYVETQWLCCWKPIWFKTCQQDGMKLFSNTRRTVLLRTLRFCLDRFCRQRHQIQGDIKHHTMIWLTLFNVILICTRIQPISDTSAADNMSTI